jgi:hypothetical protein
MPIPPLSDAEIEKVMRHARRVQIEDDEVVPKKPRIEKVQITAPNMKTVVMRIRGFAPYVQHAFSEKARTQMEETQRAGQQARSRKKRDPRDFEAQYAAAQHRSTTAGTAFRHRHSAMRVSCLSSLRPQDDLREADHLYRGRWLRCAIVGERPVGKPW